MCKDYRYPIRDVQFHEEGLREAADLEFSVDEHLAISWHSTAIAHLRYGAFHGLSGPGAEWRTASGIEPREIENFLIRAKDSDGLVYFKHQFKEND